MGPMQKTQCGTGKVSHRHKQTILNDLLVIRME